MSTALNLIKFRYNTALTVFFVPYALFEIPSNIVLKLIRHLFGFLFLSLPGAR
jgi:hypothetical protein